MLLCCAHLSPNLQGAGGQQRPTYACAHHEWSTQRRRLVQGGGAEHSGAAEEGEGGVVEHMLLMALESLYKDASEQDVRLGLLRTNLQILQRHGQLNPSLIQVLSQLSCTTETVQHPGEARPPMAENAWPVSVCIGFTPECCTVQASS